MKISLIGIGLIFISTSCYANDENSCTFPDECEGGKEFYEHIDKGMAIKEKITLLEKEIKKLKIELEIENERAKIIAKEMKICALKHDKPFEGCVIERK